MAIFWTNIENGKCWLGLVHANNNHSLTQAPCADLSINILCEVSIQQINNTSVFEHLLLEEK